MTESHAEPLAIIIRAWEFMLVCDLAIAAW
jgi:hypothetical protein